MANEKQARTQAEANAQVGAAFLMAGVNEITRLETDLAAANATIAAQRLALATMREALQRLFDVDMGLRNQISKYLPDGSGCVLAVRGILVAHEAKAILAQPADDAAALAGAVLTAADLLKHRWDRLCECVNEFEPEDMTACGEYRDLLDDAILGVIRARAALRGHGAVEG